VKSRMQELRDVMRLRSVVGGPEINAYILTTYDEHQIHQETDIEGRLQFISGFSGKVGDAVVCYSLYLNKISLSK
jgi:hypothetical protein